MHANIADKENIAGAKAYILADVEQLLDCNLAVIVEDVALGSGDEILGIFRINGSIRSGRQFVALAEPAPVGISRGFLRRHDLGENLAGDDILRIAEAVNVGAFVLAEAAPWLGALVIEIRIEIMPQVV